MRQLCGGQIQGCFNESVVEAMMDSTVVCAGTVMGGHKAMIAYMHLMSKIAHFIAKESCMKWGISQVHPAM